MLPKISKEEAIWLLEEYAPKRSFGINNKTLNMFLRAYNLMKGVEHKINCTSCEARGIAAIAKSMFNQYEAEIQAVAYPKKGRKKNAV